jgi:hypothetical protein
VSTLLALHKFAFVLNVSIKLCKQYSPIFFVNMSFICFPELSSKLKIIFTSNSDLSVSTEILKNEVYLNYLQNKERIRTISCLILFIEIISMYCERHVQHLNRVCDKIQIVYMKICHQSTLKAKVRSSTMQTKILYSHFKLDYL